MLRLCRSVGLVCLCFGAVSGRVECAEYPHKVEGKFEQYYGIEHRLNLIAKFLPENPVIIDAGAFSGADTVRFSKNWPRGMVLAFEPNPHAFKILQSTTKGIPNIFEFNVALNDQNGSATLHVCHGSNGDNPEFEGASSLLEASDWMKENYKGPEVEVPCVILDDWCKDHNIDHVDFMWLDLEGLELNVLKSSPKILSTVKVIHTETNFKEFRVGTTQYHELKKFLEKAGFKMLVHWYMQDFQGDAIFVRADLYNLAVGK